jgi:hypothetical protein
MLPTYIGVDLVRVMHDEMAYREAQRRHYDREPVAKSDSTSPQRRGPIRSFVGQLLFRSKGAPCAAACDSVA